MTITNFTFSDLESFGETNDIHETICHYILSEGVRKSYMPTGPVLCMAVGCEGFYREGTIIRDFHKRRLGKANGQVKVIGCDSHETIPVHKAQDYDLYLGGEEGDASSFSPWLRGVNEFDSLYKFVLINNPSVAVLDNWLEIYRRALSFVAEDGVIATVSIGLIDRFYLINLTHTLKKEDSMLESRMKFFHRAGLHLK